MESSSEELSQSLTGSQYDAQNASEEWTILSDNEDNDCPDIEADNECEQESSSENKEWLENSNETNKTETNDDFRAIDDNETNERLAEIEPIKPDSTSSDIDVIDEEDDSSDDELSTASLCSSSVVSQMSNLSFLRDQYLLRNHLLNPDFVNEDLSETSSLNYRELSTDVELRRGTRAYVHTPNTGLNGKLNLILILSVSTVIGLGIGHFIGWSNRQQKQLSLGQVMKLKQLQDELVVCMQTQPNWSPQLEGHNPQVCYTNNDYWRGKFETLFSENKGLLNLFEKTQKHYHLKGNHQNILSDKECVNKSASDEFHNLKLGLLVNQMEHLQLLKALEEVKYKGQQSEKRVQVLEVENSQLKMKLVEEEEDDEVIVQSWGNKVAILENENKELRTRIEDDEEEDSVVLRRLNHRIDELLAENNELKSAITQLEAQVGMVGHIPTTASSYDDYSSSYTATHSGADHKVPIKLDLLKQRINQMVLENDELKSTIARLRWSYHQSQEESDQLIDEEVVEVEEQTAEDVSQLEEELNQLKDMLTTEQKESQKWKQMYEKLLKSKNNEMPKNQKNKQNSNNNNNNNPNFDENIIYDWVLNSTSLLREALVRGSNVVGDRFKSMFAQMTKNESIFPSDVFNGINFTQSILFELNRRLQNKWQELQDFKTVFSNGEQKMSNKMSKLLAQTLRKLQEAGNKLVSKEKTMKARVKQFSNRITKLVDQLDNKWNDLLNKLSKRYSKQTNSGDENESEKSENSIPKTNWFFERANSRRQQTTNAFTDESADRLPPKPSESVVDLDEEELSDSSGAEDEAPEQENENWFLKKGKKPKTNSYYQFETSQQRTRRLKSRQSQQFQKFHYDSRQR